MPTSISVAASAEAPSSKRTADRLVDDRAAKRRASRACLSCRGRKVRCDLVTSGMPCTNCKLDDVECMVRESVRGRKPKRLMALTAVNAAASAAATHAITVTAPTPGDPLPLPSPAQGNDADPFLVSLTFEEQPGGETMDSPDDDSHDDVDDFFAVEDALTGALLPDTNINAVSPSQSRTSHASQSGQSQRSRRSHHSLQTHLSQHSHHSQRRNRGQPNAVVSHKAPPVGACPLPPYIKRLPSHITPRDMSYLAERDALTIPDTEFRDELLRTYVKIVYCFVPALDLDDFLDPIIHGDNSHPVSLLLFQAVMFASVVFVDRSLLTARGFTTRKDARKVFFNRVRVLYGLDCEPDRLALIQSLLLMTSWYDSPDDEKDTWYWMGIALSLAQVMGLHRDPDTLQISLKQKRLRRRIWWSCFIRDRLLALGIRRPARIRADEYSVRMLDLADFDLVQPGQVRIVFVRESGFTAVEEDGRRQMCQICIDLAKLCVCVGDVLRSQYSVVTTDAEAHKTMAVLPRPLTDANAADLAQRDRELAHWFAHQTATSRYVPRSAAAAADPRAGQRKDDWAEDILWLHQALLHMIYLATLGVLHRPRALMRPVPSPSWHKPSAEAVALRKSSLAKVKDAAAAMTRLAFDLQAENHLRYVWTSGVPAFLSATQIHLLDVNDPDEQVRNMSLGRFYQCFNALCELQDMYTSVDYALRFLEIVLAKAGTSVPMMRMLKAGSALSYGNRRPAVSTPVRNSPPSPHGGCPQTVSLTYPVMAALQAPPTSQMSYCLPMQAAPTQSLPAQTYTEFMRALSPAPDMPDHSAADDPDLLLHGDGFGPLSDPSAGADTLVESPSRHMDMWSEFDGLLFTLPDFDAVDPGEGCEGMHRHDPRLSSAPVMASDSSTVAVTALTSTSAPCAFY